MDLAPAELDLLQEVFNAGIDASAASLSGMAGHEVLLDVPEIRLLAHGEVAEQLLADRSGPVCAVVQQFLTREGPGTAVLMFPEVASSQLIQSLRDEDEVPDGELRALEPEALTEVANVILNACLANLSRLGQAELELELPHFLRGQRAQLLQPDDCGEDAVMWFAIRLELRNQVVRGELAVLWELDPLRSLLRRAADGMGYKEVLFAVQRP